MRYITWQSRNNIQSNRVGFTAKGDDVAAVLDELRTMYARSALRLTETHARSDELDDFLGRLKTLHGKNFVFRDHYLDLAASMFDNVGR